MEQRGSYPLHYIPERHILRWAVSFTTALLCRRHFSGGRIRRFRSMTIHSPFSRRMYIRYTTTENGMCHVFPSQKASTTSMITVRAWIFPDTKIFRCRPLTWQSALILILWVVMTIRRRPDCSMWQTTIFHPERSSGPGAVVNSVKHGIAT